MVTCLPSNSPVFTGVFYKDRHVATIYSLMSDFLPDNSQNQYFKRDDTNTFVWAYSNYT